VNELSKEKVGNSERALTNLFSARALLETPRWLALTSNARISFCEKEHPSLWHIKFSKPLLKRVS